MHKTDLLDKAPLTPPVTQLLWTAIVDVAPRQELEPTPEGARFRVPILGGQFHGGPGAPELSGEVPAGGADWQTLRPDGVKLLDARYDMVSQSGAVLHIRNQVTVDDSRQPLRYAMSVIGVTTDAPDLKWLERRLILGTLQSLRPDRAAVVVRAWLADC